MVTGSFPPGFRLPSRRFATAFPAYGPGIQASTTAAQCSSAQGSAKHPGPVQHQHHRLSGLHDRFQQRLLLARQVQMAAVLPFPAGDMDPAAVAAHRHHDDIRSFRRFHRFGKALPAGGDDVAALRVPDGKAVFQLLPGGDRLPIARRTLVISWICAFCSSL